MIRSLTSMYRLGRAGVEPTVADEATAKAVGLFAVAVVLVGGTAYGLGRLQRRAIELDRERQRMAEERATKKPERKEEPPPTPPVEEEEGEEEEGEEGEEEEVVVGADDRDVPPDWYLKRP